MESKRNFSGNQSKLHDDYYNQKFDLDQYEPKDLGVELFHTIKKEYKQKNQQTTFDPKVLYQYWKGMSKAKLNQPKQTKARPPSVAPTAQTLPANINKKMTKHHDEKKVHKQNVNFYYQCDKRDVKFTLEKYAKEEEDDLNISNAFKENEKREDEQKIKTQKSEKSKHSKKEVLDRLYPMQPAEKEQTDLERQQEKRSLFMRKLISFYKFENLDADNFRKPEILYPFWEQYDNKANGGVEGQPKQVQEDMELYFQERCEIIIELFYKKNGYTSEDPKVIGESWKKFVSNEDKIKYQINFESERNVEDLMGEYLKQRKEQDGIANTLQSNIMKNKQKDDRERLAKQVLKGKVIKATELNKMAKHKDRMIVGKTLLELKKMHPDDKVLRKMLIQEFQETKHAKHPLEYDIVDSDEENKIKLRHKSQKGGMVMKIEDMELPDKMRAEELAELFEQHLNDFHSTKNKDLRKQEEKRRALIQQDNQLRRYIEKGSEKYLHIRKRRFEEKVKSLNEYLSGLYRDCLKMYKDATIKHFPHKTYGESKRLKKRSFPSSLKRYFFACMKAYVKRKYANVKDHENRLAFWAPTNTQGGRHTLNKRVFEQTKTTKEEKINSEKPETSVWDKEGYTKERQKIMMTYSDAKECTFQPMVCYRMPNKLKKQMRETHNWAPGFIDKKGNFENFLKKFGQNFSRFPRIYKYGIYCRAQQHSRRNEYVAAYKLIAEHFDIPSMKIEFHDPDRKKFHPIFNYNKMGIEEADQKKLPPEDYKDGSNRNFLLEVYQFIKNLERFELGLEKAKQSLMKVIRKSDKIHRFTQSAGFDHQQSSYASRKNMIKDQMCPLGQECPSIQQRWPNSSVKGVTPLGAECLFAHHIYELKFAKELKEKRRILNDVLKKINQKLSGEQKQKPFNPGGGHFSDCIGCGENLGSKGNKGICGTCQMRKYNSKRLQQFQEKAQATKHRITGQHSFKVKNREREQVHQSINRKMGCLAKASALCAKERYSEAFKVIIEAVEIIKQELEVGESKFTTKSLHLKKHLGLDRDMEVTAEQVFLSTLPQNYNPDDIHETQKLHMYASQTGLINNNPPDVNEFINLQVERMYLKIEEALQSYVRDIELMKNKIEKLEDEDDKAAKGKNGSPEIKIATTSLAEFPYKKKHKNKMTKMCPEMMEKGYCEKGYDLCVYAHNAIELDLVPNDKKIDSLGKSIKKRTEDLKESKAFPSFVQSGIRGSTQYQQTQDRDRDADIKRLRQSPKTGLTKARSFKDHNIKSIYDKDIDDLKTPIDERRKKAY